MAFAGARFAINILEATVGGKTGIVEPTYVDLSAPVEGAKTVKEETQDCEYFATNVELGKEGIAKIHAIGELSEFEQKLLAEAIPQIKANVQSGIQFISKA
ncbi:malate DEHYDROGENASE, NAD-dependent [Basidiobolus ranarum]|uniref:Malate DEHYDROGENASE, NAD-dependent n=1 Tax=Basidiobolus ranarum TaxID=34480 RepID=A0ABR2VKZ8_9FUNG